jgi:sulfide:quinone oxidoreductase
MATLEVTRVPDRPTVSLRPGPEDFPAFAAPGVKLISNDRIDGEEAGQLSAGEGAKLAAKTGMAHRHVPVRQPELGIAEFEAFSEALRSTDGPTHAHWRSGVRAALLRVLPEVMAGRFTALNVGPAIEAIGFDPEPAVAAQSDRVPT